MIQPTDTLSSIAAQFPCAIQVLEEAGVDYCCHGDRTVDQACREKGLQWETLAAAIQNVPTATQEPTVDWTREPLVALIRHILSTHHEFLKRGLPRLSEQLGRVQIAHPRDREMLQPLAQVFTGLFEELDQHMAKEERILFPFIDQMEAAIAQGKPPIQLPFGTMRNPIGMMEYEHESAGRALKEIRHLTSAFIPPPHACATYCALYEGLRELERDLHLHIHLENNILFPRALDLESRAGSLAAFARK